MPDGSTAEEGRKRLAIIVRPSDRQELATSMDSSERTSEELGRTKRRDSECEKYGGVYYLGDPSRQEVRMESLPVAVEAVVDGYILSIFVGSPLTIR